MECEGLSFLIFYFFLANALFFIDKLHKEGEEEEAMLSLLTTAFNICFYFLFFLLSAYLW